jgi:hypothetical protein
MESQIRDLECLFNAVGPKYVVEVRAPGKRAAPLASRCLRTHASTTSENRVYGAGVVVDSGSSGRV